MINQKICDRLAALRAVMEKNGVDWYMVPTADFHNSEYVDAYFKVREYLCNFSGSNGTLIIGKQEAGLWTDGRYFIQAERELEGTGVTLYRMLEEGVPTKEEFLEQKMQPGQTLGFDGRVVDTRFGRKLEKILDKKQVRIAYEKDLANEVWTDRPELPCHPVLVPDEALFGRTVEQKLSQVREQMEKKGAGSLFLSKLDDLMWLLNIRGADVECNPVALSYAYVTDRECHLFLQEGEVTEDLRAHAAKYGIVLHPYEETASWLSACPVSGKVLCDEGNVSYAFYKLLSSRAEVIGAASPTELLKAVKNETELANMKQVYLKDSAAVCRFIYWVKKNVGKIPMTEYTAAMHLDGLRAQIDGYLDLSFPTISAYGANAAMMHYEATKESAAALEPRGMLLVDSGGQYLGGTTDVTRTMVLGPITPEEKAHYTAVAMGMLQLTDAKFLYGCSGRNLDILARQPMWDQNIDYKCGTGHGVGYILNVHEGPQGLRWRFVEGQKEVPIEAGMDITNEPGIYIEGSHGIRIENVMVARNGVKNGDGQFMYFETLTWAPIDLDAIDTSLMQPKDIERLNRYHAQVYEKMAPFLEGEELAWLKEATRAVQ
ncbi:MAG: aminopeptidase P family protein [Eubacteriales bacterium]|nr:aminopeptidase P family protein [Eubacteriales bacterium]